MMALLESIFSIVLAHSYVSILIVIVTLLVRKVLRPYLNPVAIYAIWFLLLIKLLIPVAPQSVLSVFNFLPETSPTNINWYQTHEATELMSLDDIKNQRENAPSSPLQTSDDHAGNTTGSSETAPSLSSSSMNPTPSSTTAANSSSTSQQPLGKLTLLPLMWLSGVLLLSSYYGISNWRFRQRIRETRKLSNTRLNDILVESKHQLGMDSSIAIYETSYLRSPCIYGILKPSIYIPEDVVTIANTQQLTHIVMHELMHFKRKDLWVNFLWAIALGIHWFNPVVWWAVRKMRADQEIACDSGVLSSLDEQEMSDYGLTLLMMSRLFKPRSAPQIHLSSFFNRKSETKRRIIMVANFKKGSYKKTALAIVLLTVLGAVLLTNSISSPNNKESGNKSTIMNTATSLENNTLLSSSAPNEFGSLSNTMKWFNSLDRAIQFIPFNFKVPDYIPEGYFPTDISWSKSLVDPDHADQSQIVSIYYYSTKASDSFHSIEVLAAIQKQSLLDQNVLLGAFRSNHRDEKPFKQATMTFGDVTGTLYTGKPSRGPNHTKSTLDYSFVWENNGVTYGINFRNNISNTADTDLDGNLAQADLAKIIASLVTPQQVQHVDYSGEGNSFPIYMENDLVTVQNTLGFKPKVPTVIQGTEFELLNSLLLREDDTNTELSYSRLGDTLWNSYRIKSFPRTNKYDLNDEISLLQSKKPLFDTNKLSYQRQFTLNELDISVYTEEELSYHKGMERSTGDDGRKTFQTPTYYMWQQDGIYYTVVFTFFEKDINDDELLEALILSLEE